MRDAAVRTLGEALAAGRAQLDAAGIAQSTREVARLWAAVSGGRPGGAALERDRVLAAPEADALNAAIQRRAAGEPFAYVTGVGGFRFLEVGCDRRALIPRPETEGLVERTPERVPGGRVADIGTGTGCIALSLAQEGRFDQVIGVDRSRDAIALAASNVARQAARVALVVADLTAPFAAESLDALVSNPPYLSVEEYAGLDGAVRDWEPADALVSGADGLEATFRLLEDGRRVVRRGGWIVMELDCTRAAVVARRASALGWRDVAVESDLFGRERYLLARRSMES